MRLIIAIAAVAFSLGAQAQTAKVIELKPADAKMAKQLDDELKSLAKRRQDFEDHVRDSYLKAPKEDEGHTEYHGYISGTNAGYWIRYGWGDGKFQYSEDFRFIVPVEWR